MNTSVNNSTSEQPIPTPQMATPAAAPSFAFSPHGIPAMPSPVQSSQTQEPPAPSPTSPMETSTSPIAVSSSSPVHNPKVLHRRRCDQHQQESSMFAPIRASSMSNDAANPVLPSVPMPQYQHSTPSDSGSLVTTIPTTVPLTNVMHSEGNTYWARTSQRRLRCDEAAHSQRTDHERLRHKKRSNQPSSTWAAFIATPTTPVASESSILPNTPSL